MGGGWGNDESFYDYSVLDTWTYVFRRQTRVKLFVKVESKLVTL